jgi:outer membrane protein OmpA-like peptidoglycan-associated protein
MIRRRDLLAATGAALAFRPRRACAATPEQPPTSIDHALDQFETLIAPEALAAFYAAPEDDVRELNMGLVHIYLSRGWTREYGHVPSLATELKARGVPSDRTYAYLLTVLWRRKHRLPVDTPRVLQSIERQERLISERRQPWNYVIDDREHFLWMPVVRFDEDAVRPRPSGDALDYVVETMQKPTSVCALAQVQGHASADEPHARTLSLVRARVIVARLVRRGIDPARLVAHGLGTRFPAPPPPPCPKGLPLGEMPADCIHPDIVAARAPDRDRRVEIFCLRRRWVPPDGSPSP